jgi:glutamate dehydrogenase (NAD(P)+)
VDHEPLMKITWTDAVTGRHGYLVVHNLVRGLASGGLRLRDGCTLDEVAGLARGMASKEALLYDPADRYIPLGGAKGGIDIDPRDPDARDVLRRFLTATLPIVREQWNTGEDFGLRQQTLDEVAGELGLRSTIEPLFRRLDDAPAARERLRRALAVTVDGVALADLVGGCGVAAAAIALAEREGIEVKGATAAIQGFGSIGGATARHLDRAGVRVVAIADRAGLIVNDEGLDVESLLAARDTHGVIDRTRLRPGDRTGGDGTGRTGRPETSAWLETSADLLVPAAMSYVIGAADAARIRARIVVEGANLPTLPEAEAALAARGVPVLPDFLANVMTNAWWWWVVFGDIEPTAEASFARITRTSRRLVTQVADCATTTGGSLREAALALAERNAAEIAARFA